MEPTLVRLTNNDRIVGLLMDYSYGTVALYAPMIIKTEYSIGLDTDKDPKGYYVYSPYDPLSASCFVVFDARHVLTVSKPKDIVVDYYESAWIKYYPKFEDFKKSFEEELDDYDTNSFNSEKLQEMFSEFLKGTDKKKLN